MLCLCLWHCHLMHELMQCMYGLAKLTVVHLNPLNISNLRCLCTGYSVCEFFFFLSSTHWRSNIHLFSCFRFYLMFRHVLLRFKSIVFHRSQELFDSHLCCSCVCVFFYISLSHCCCTYHSVVVLFGKSDFLGQ